MTKEEFINRIESLNTYADCVSFQREICADENIWFFENQFGSKAHEKYLKFRSYMAEKFSISPQEVTIGGSAKFGFSLNPRKNYKEFDLNSDIDIVIISEKLFESLWDDLLESFVKNEYGLGSYYDYASSNVFKRFIDTKKLDRFLGTNYLKWIQKTEGYIRDLQIDYNFPEKIGYRIYISYEDYNINVIKNLKDLKGDENENN